MTKIEYGGKSTVGDILDYLLQFPRQASVSIEVDFTDAGDITSVFMNVSATGTIQLPATTK